MDSQYTSKLVGNWQLSTSDGAPSTVLNADPMAAAVQTKSGFLVNSASIDKPHVKPKNFEGDDVGEENPTLESTEWLSLEVSSVEPRWFLGLAVIEASDSDSLSSVLKTLLRVGTLFLLNTESRFKGALKPAHFFGTVCIFSSKLSSQSSPSSQISLQSESSSESSESDLPPKKKLAMGQRIDCDFTGVDSFGAESTDCEQEASNNIDELSVSSD